MKKFDKRILMIPVVVLTTIVVVVMLVRSTKAFEVIIDDKVIGVVKSEAAFSTIVEDIKKSAEIKHGKELMLTNKIDYKEVYLPDDNSVIDVSSQTSLAQVEENFEFKATVFAINVDGKDIALLKEKVVAEDILDRVKAPFLEDAGDSVITFAEDVSIIERVVTSDELGGLNVADEVYNSIMEENETLRTYVVQKGDTVSEIAEKLGVSMKDMLKANPDLNVDRISIDQELNMAVPRYVLNVKQSTLIEYEDIVPYEVEYEETDELYKGNTEVKVPGVEGTKQVKAEQICINGFLEETKVVSEVITLEPQTAILYKGTKPRPRTLAFGSFYWPSRGRRVTSSFGARWGEQHSGIDIGAPKGTSNKAADGGVIKFAGWSGNYGKLIIIDHENGYTTYYGHNDTIKVKVGQRVARGEVIGTVGDTGRTTGPHLHFEVRKNGVAVNPMKYLK